LISGVRGRVTTEVCDARPSYVEENVGEFVDNVGRYCPWSARLVELRNYTGGEIEPPPREGILRPRRSQTRGEGNGPGHPRPEVVSRRVPLAYSVEEVCYFLIVEVAQQEIVGHQVSHHRVLLTLLGGAGVLRVAVCEQSQVL
jgi:hypothetical protein